MAGIEGQQYKVTPASHRAVLFQVPAALFLMWLLANMPGKEAKNGSSTRALVTPMGDPDEVPGFRLWLDQDMAAVGTWGSKLTEGRSSPSFYPSLYISPLPPYHSAFQINKYIF